MPDNLSTERRSWNMSRIKNKDTSIEVSVRKWLFANGFRYRKNVSKLPGRPDVVLAKYKTAIFVHGCFWHRHGGCKDATTPKTRTEFWLKKFQKNVDNDIKHAETLESAGWNVITIWECEIEKNFDSTMQRLKETLLSKEAVSK